MVNMSEQGFFDLVCAGNYSKNEIDYTKFSQKQLTELIDDALDKKDYEEVKRLSQYMKKEGREIYLKELERINESYKYHTRRK